MGTLEESITSVLRNYKYNPKDFWASPQGLSLGAGLVYSDITYPLLDIQKGLYDTVSGMILVLTHECDIDKTNDRYFNEELIICPILPFGDFIENYIEEISNDNFKNSFLPALSKGDINRVMYVPSIETEALPHGGLIYFNQLCSTHITMFDGKTPIAATSALGLQQIDIKMRNHLFRPKSEELPLTRSLIPSIFRGIK